MKKIIFVLLLLTFVSLLPPAIRAQTDCRKIFDKESYTCLTDSNACSDACMKETEKPDGTSYFNSGEIYKECIKSSDCEGKSSACSEKALAKFKACGTSGEQGNVVKIKKEPMLPLRIITDWALETKIVPARREGVFSFETVTDKSLEETLNWQPVITNNVEEKAWKEFLPIYTPGKENITIISPEFITIGPKGGDTVQVTYLDSTIQSTSDNAQLRYTWSPDSGAVMNVVKSSEITFQKPVEIGGSTSHSVKLEQGEIEVRVRNTNLAENQFGVDAGWLGVTASRTHFWVSQSKDKKIAVVGVFEGEVEVKTSDGKTVKVIPDGDKPGVVVVSQKLSLVKLALAAVIVAVIVGGIIHNVKPR